MNIPKCFVKIYIWLFAGVFLSIGAGLLNIGGELHLQNPMDQEQIYDVPREDLTSSSATWLYAEEYGVFVMQTPKASKLFTRIPDHHAWNYLHLIISRMHTTSMYGRVIFYSGDRQVIGTQDILIANGENMIPISVTEPFRRLRIMLPDQTGLPLSIDSMQLRMNTTGFSREKFQEGAAGAALVYLFLSFIAFVALSVRREDALDLLQSAYTLPGDYLGSRLARALPKRARAHLRVFLFLLLFLTMPVIHICGLYYEESFYRYAMTGCALLLIMIALLSWEAPLHGLKWGNALHVSWFLLWGWVCLSDLVAIKDIKLTGCLFLLAVGFFFFLWNNMSYPKRMLRDMMRGLEWTFPCFLVYTLICRKRYVGILYNGAFASREDLSLYALALLIAFLFELQFALFAKSARRRGAQIALYACGAAFAVYFLYRAFTPTCIAAGIAVILLFAILLFREYRILAFGVLRTAEILAASLVCSGLLIWGVNRLTMVLPDALNTAVVYDKETLTTNLNGEQMAEIEAVSPDYFANVIHTGSEDRAMILKNYLRKMNFFGNESARVRVGRKWELSGNGLLEMAYRYGIFVLIPYSLLLLLCLYTAWRSHSFLMLAVTVSFELVLLTQNVEQPFLQPLWVMFYLGMGSWFGGQEETKEGVGR